MKRRKFIFKSMTAAAGTMILPTIIPSSVFGKGAPSDKINIGQIGAGRIAMTHDLPETLKNNIARVVAIADPDVTRLACGKKYVKDFYNRKTGSSNYINVRTYEDYSFILDDKDIDAVIISTPNYLHPQAAIDSALAGKDIYLQLPISLTVSGGRLLSDIVKNNGIILQTGTWHRSIAGFRIASVLVRNGRIGKLETVKIGLRSDLSEPECHHYFGSAAWGMDTELTGPVSVETVAQFPESDPGRHGDFIARADYSNGITMLTSRIYPNGITYEGTEGWIYVAHDPVSADFNDTRIRMPDASDIKLFTSLKNEPEIQLNERYDLHGNWIDCIKSRKQPVSPVETGHRCGSVGLITLIAMRTGRKLAWNPDEEKFLNDDEANLML